ncbi:MAG: hypothetical protein ACP5OU_05025, partial [Methanothrix sp.]
VTNNGKVPLDSVTIVDALPEGMEYNSSSPAGYPEGQDITRNLEEPLLVGKSKEIELVARIIQTTPGILNNTVNATGRHPNGTVKANGSEEVEVIPCNARISIQKNVSPSSGYPLTIVKFIIKVTNTGNQPLNPVTVKDDLPNGLNFVDSTPEGTKDGQNISWTFPQMDPGQSEYIKLLAQIDWFASGNMHNCVEAIGILPNGLNITDIGDKPVKAMNCAIVNVIPIPPPTGLGCCNCCNNCCNCPGNITNNINLNNSGQGIQVVTIGPANVSNLRQKTNNSSNKYNEIKS